MKKNKKIKKVMKIWEKVFILGSILIIVGFLVLYSTRLIRYYKIEHPKVDKSDKRLITAVLRDNKTVIKDDGLYQDENNKDNYYFKGKEINNNYVYYSGKMWRIISIEKDTITLITDANQTSIVWGINTDFEKSYINEWLTSFLKNLNNYETNVVKSSYCTDQIKLDSITCKKKYETNIGLIAVEEYLRAGGSKSYLNTSEYFWTINSSEDSKIWYVFDEGGVNNESKTEVTYHSYGVRPVIKIKKDISSYSGTGTINDPYYLDDNTNTILSSKKVGNYLTFSNYKWRIQDITDNYVKLIMDDYYKVDEKDIKVKYDEENPKYNTSSILSEYLNNKVYKSIKSSSLKKCDFYIGSYGENSKYNYKSAYKEKMSAYVGVPSVGEMFITDFDNIWLSNNVDDIKLVSYTAKKQGILYADSITNSNYIRPVICVDSNLAVSSGNGLKDNPFVVEEK